MLHKLVAIFHAFANLLVVVTVITIITAILTILPYASVHRRVTWVACLVIAILGTIAVIYEMRRLYRLDRSRALIGELLAEGQQVKIDIIARKLSRNIANYPAQTFEDLEEYGVVQEWCKRTEDALRDIDHTYATRFHLGGSNVQDAESMTIWKLNHRLETLAGFLKELR